MTAVIVAASMNESDAIAWIYVLIIFTTVTFFVAFLVSRLFKGGPYVPNSYKKGTYRSSFWSVRPINDELINSQFISEEKEIT